MIREWDRKRKDIFQPPKEWTGLIIHLGERILHVDCGTMKASRLILQERVMSTMFPATTSYEIDAHARRRYLVALDPELLQHVHRLA